VTPEGPIFPDEGSDLPLGGSGQGPDPSDLFGSAPDDGNLRGWLPPDDRLWRHPSELGPSSDCPDQTAIGTDSSRDRRRTWAIGLVITSAAAVIAVGVVLMNTVAPTAPVNATDASATTVDVMSSVPVTAEQAMVALVVYKANGMALESGVAVAQGGIVATTVDALQGATSVVALTPNGRSEPVQLIAEDSTSDIALLRVPVDLPVPRFVDDSDINSGFPAEVISIMPSAFAVGAVPVWSTGTIESVGTALGDQPSGMAGIAATAPVVGSQSGAVLLDASGSVMGILDKSASGTRGGDVDEFVPAQLLLGVSNQLVSTGTVRHGWLDISGQDAGGRSQPRGALVLSVDPGGPAYEVLQPGDIIEGVNGTPVRSMAELRSRLYVLTPGTPIRLDVWRNKQQYRFDVNLSASP
jgi:S1-C subfamily serine protease